jgi:hypothetical protein
MLTKSFRLMTGSEISLKKRVSLESFWQHSKRGSRFISESLKSKVSPKSARFGKRLERKLMKCFIGKLSVSGHRCKVFKE